MLGTTLAITAHTAVPGIARPAGLLAWRAAPKMSGAGEDEEARQERLKQLFGDTFKDVEDRELARVTEVKQPRKAEPPPVPAWATAPEGSPEEWRATRLFLWLEDAGVKLDNVLIVRTEGRFALVSAQEVAAGETLFEIPDKLLLTADAAFADPDVGRGLRVPTGDLAVDATVHAQRVTAANAAEVGGHR